MLQWIYQFIESKSLLIYIKLDFILSQFNYNMYILFLLFTLTYTYVNHYHGVSYVTITGTNFRLPCENTYSDIYITNNVILNANETHS